MKKWITGILAAAACLAVAAGIYLKEKQSVAIIGGADGPTSIFLAGKLNSDITNGMILLGVAVLAGIVVWQIKKRRK